MHLRLRTDSFRRVHPRLECTVEYDNNEPLYHTHLAQLDRAQHVTTRQIACFPTGSKLEVRNSIGRPREFDPYKLNTSATGTQ